MEEFNNFYYSKDNYIDVLENEIEFQSINNETSLLPDSSLSLFNLNDKENELIYKNNKNIFQKNDEHYNILYKHEFDNIPNKSNIDNTSSKEDFLFTKSNELNNNDSSIYEKNKYFEVENFFNNNNIDLDSQFDNIYNEYNINNSLNIYNDKNQEIKNDRKNDIRVYKKNSPKFIIDKNVVKKNSESKINSENDKIFKNINIISENDKTIKNVNVNSLSTSTLDSTSIIGNIITNRKGTRKNDADCIRKKIKSKLFNNLKNLLNLKLKNAKCIYYFEYLPKEFISNIKKEVNKKILNYKIKQIYMENFGDNHYYLKFQNNIKTLNYIESHKNLEKYKEINCWLNMTYRDIIEMYYNSKCFENDLKKLKDKNASDEYINAYKFFTGQLIDFFTK